MADICLKRLRKEYIAIKKNPPANIRAAPLDTNMLEWHYVIEGIKGSVYEGGWYHGMMIIKSIILFIANRNMVQEY